MVTLERAEVRVSAETVLSRKSETDLVAPSSLSPLQIQVDALVQGFVEEAACARTLVSLMAGAMAYRVGRLGVMGSRFGQVFKLPLQQPLSIAVGLGAEVTAFEFTNRTLQTVGANLVFAPVNGRSQGSAPQQHNPNLWSWSGTGGWKEGLLSSFICFGALKGAGFLGREENEVVRHIFQSTAMVAGQKVASEGGILSKPEGDLAEQLFHAEALNLQMQAGMGLIPILAPRLYFSERALDLSLQASEGPSFPGLYKAGSRLLFAAEGLSQGSGLGESGRKTLEGAGESSHEAFQKIIQRPMATLGTGEGEPLETEMEKTLQREKLGKTFHDPLKKIFTHEIAVSDILDSVMEIPSRLKSTRTHFLASLTHSRLTDPTSAYLMILAVREVFKRNALYSSMGSYEDALIQLFAQSALTDSDPGRTGFALRGLYETLKKGGTPRVMEELLENYGYGEGDHLSESERRQKKEELLATFSAMETKLYSPQSFLSALEFASESLMAGVVFRRIEQIFKNQDHPAKVLELRKHPPADQGQGLYERLREKRVSEVIKEIDGTHLTAFLTDPRLARKVASVSETEYRYRVKNPDQIPQNRLRLEQKVESFLRNRHRLMPGEFVEFIALNGGELARQVAREWQKRSFEILILSSPDYEEKVKDLSGDLKGSLVSVMREGHGKRQFILRDLSHDDLSTLEQYQRAFLGFISRLSHFVQKWELTQQLGYEEYFKILGGMLPPPPHPLHHRLILRMLSSLEEHRWMLQNGFPLEWELADRMGGMVLHLRSWNEHLLSGQQDPSFSK